MTNTLTTKICDGFKVWNYFRPERRGSTTVVEKWVWAPLSACGTYYVLSSGTSEHVSMAEAEAAAEAAKWRSLT